MSAVAALLEEAKAAGIRFEVKGPGQLGLCARKAPPPELVARIKAAKPALLVVLGALPLDTPREWREGVAMLQAMSCPDRVPAKAWAELVTNSVRFIGSTFAARTAALGWTTTDLWGCHAMRPWQRIDYLGVLWLVHDGEFVAVTADTITIRTSTGPRLTSRRLRQALSGVCLAWELGR